MNQGETCHNFVFHTLLITSYIFHNISYTINVYISPPVDNHQDVSHQLLDMVAILVAKCASAEHDDINNVLCNHIEYPSNCEVLENHKVEVMS